MNEWRQWRNDAVKQSILRGWRREGSIDTATAERANAVLGSDPSPAQWRWFLERIGLWLGVALCAAGVICLIAANWEDLGKFTRLYGMQAVLVLAVGVAWRLGLSRIAGQAALWLATILLGGLLALIGQTYQTGADTWELFALWTVLSLPWVFAGRHAALWLLWAMLLNVSCALWLDLRPRHIAFQLDNVLSVLGLLNLLLLMAWEAAGTRWQEFTGRAGRLLLAATMTSFVSFGAMTEILDEHTGGGVVLWVVATLAMCAFFLRIRRDLAVLAMLALGVIVVVTSALARWLVKDNDWSVSYMLIALMVIAQAALAAFTLRRLARAEVA